MKHYQNETFDEERALYGACDIEVRNCAFAGPRDGESALKECHDISIYDTQFDLRYPLWHVTHAKLDHIQMSETCRAALWYDHDIMISNSTLQGIKAVRECEHVTLQNNTINSSEFGWFTRYVTIDHCTLASEYPFMQARHLQIHDLMMKGKYSFQYVEDMTITNANLDTKDAFWHSRNVTVMDSVIKGEYLAWYSENLTLIRCKIIGTQPFCYAKNLVLQDCEMIDTDLAFEKSDVFASITTPIDSIKNPISGRIEAPEIKAIILSEGHESTCDIITKQTVK